MDRRATIRQGVTIKEWPEFGMADVCYVVDHMRAIDRAEFAALGLSPDVAADQVRVSWDAYMVYLEGEPVFCAGTTQSFAGVRTLWGFGTDLTRRIMPVWSEWVQTWRDRLFHEEGVRRVEVRLPEASKINVKWLVSLGFGFETRLERYGSDGRPFVQLSLTGPSAQNKAVRACVSAAA